MSDDLRDEYQFDYRQAKPNRFAAALKKGGRLVVLDPEVAAAFQQSDAVNAVLRALLQTMPGRQERETRPNPVPQATGPAPSVPGGS
jgi:hypothetical protein